MRNKLSNRTILFFVITLVLSVLSLIVPYATSDGPVPCENCSNIVHLNRIICDIPDNLFLILPLIFPFLFLAQNALFPKKLKLKHRLIFVIQALLGIVLIFLLWGNMVLVVLGIAAVNHVIINLIIVYHLVPIFWSCLLVIPFFDKYSILRLRK